MGDLASELWKAWRNQHNLEKKSKMDKLWTVGIFLLLTFDIFIKLDMIHWIELTISEMIDEM